MAELPEPDGKGIAVARHADVAEAAIGRVGSHGDRGHAPGERAERRRGASDGIGFNRLAAGEHQNNQGAGEVFPKQQ